MDIFAKQRELFFNNLLILGFEKSSVEKEYRVKCDKDLFSLPNQKMFEVVTHFLFGKLNEVSTKEYKLPWPLLDKELRRQFQKSAVSYLTNIAQESNIRFPRVVLSVVATFGGDRFCELYLAFSAHVVEKTVRKNGNVSLILRPSVSKHNSQDAVKTLKIATLHSGEKLQEVQNLSLKSYELSLQTSNNFITHIQKLKSTLTTNSSLLKEKNAFLTSSFHCESDVNENPLAYSIGKIFECSKKVKKHWKQLKTFFEKEKKFWEYLFPAIKENPETFFLDGAQLEFDLSDTIKEHCPELNEICSIKTQEGKVCLIKFLNVYSIFLKMYEKILLKGDLHQIQKLSNVQRSWSFESDINELKTIHEKLFTSVSNMKENNKALKDRLFLEEASEDIQIFTKECPSWNFSCKRKDEINSTRQILADNITEDILKTSLFANDSGLDSGNWKGEDDTFCSNKTDVSVTRPDTFSSESTSFASVTQPKQHLQTIDDDDDFDSLIETQKTSILNTLRKHRLKSEDTKIPHLVRPSIINTEKTPLCQSSLHTTGLIFDIDFDYHRTREIRPSWLLEESLDSVTLPETSFLD